MLRSLRRIACAGLLLTVYSDGLALTQAPDPLQTLLRERRWTEALPLAREAVRKQPNSGAALLTLGLVLHSQRQFVQAHHALRRAEQLLPGNPEVHRLLGLNYYALEQYGLFEQQMRKAKELRPDNGEFDYWLGRYQQAVAEDCGKAIPFFARAISLDNENHRAIYNRGDCFEHNGELAAAERDYAAAIELIRRNGARDSWPFQALANLLLRTDRPAEALAFAHEALSLEPDVEANHLTLGKVWAQKDDVPHAIQEFEKAAFLNPAGANTRYQLYRLYLKAGDRKAAEKELVAYESIIATYRMSQGTR